MKLIIGTQNKSKLDQIRRALLPLNISAEPLPSKDFPEIKEDGQTVLENAKRKALSYSSVLGVPVLSMDNALYFDTLQPERQPGLKVRHINGRVDRPTDAEALAYYSKLIAELGGRTTGHWDYGVCLAYPDGQTETICIRSERTFVSQASPVVLEGYPLESLQVDATTGRYLSEMAEREKNAFWERTIGAELCAFIKRSRWFKMS